MAVSTRIEWCDHTWSPWIGCQKVGPGCDHCYAEALNKRTGGDNWGPGSPRRRTSDAYWKQPLRWEKAAIAAGKRPFVFPSLCDPFDNAVDPEWRREWFQLIRATPHLVWLLLTKRPQNILGRTPIVGLPENVALGCTLVTQDEANRDVSYLRAAQSELGPAFSFLSIEPMLGPIDLGAIGIDWVICGGESGGGARPIHPDWARSMRDQCAAAGVPFLFKQWGEWAPVGPLYSDSDTDEHMAALEVEDGPREMLLTQGGTRWADDAQPPTGTWAMRRLGKRLAGRLLDGVTHDGFPPGFGRNARGR